MSDSKYLYLTRPEWVATWIAGGEVPLQLASAYCAKERIGTMTPDEVIHRELHGISERDFESVAKIGSKGTVFMSIGQVTIGGKIRGQNVSFTQRHSDGVILCLSNSFSEAVMERLHKTACVEIPNWKRLLATISEQLGIFGIGRAVEYTVSTDRNHFLKSIEDKWQDEFRIFWSLPAAVTIKIPSGIALPKHNGAQAK